jgi:hypothetical protein
MWTALLVALLEYGVAISMVKAQGLAFIGVPGSGLAKGIVL